MAANSLGAALIVRLGVNPFADLRAVGKSGRSGHRSVEQMAVLGHRARQDREVDLTVRVDGHDADHGLGLAVASEQQRARSHPLGSVGVGQCRPAEAVVVLGVEVGYEI